MSLLVLVPMTEKEYESWAVANKIGYAEEIVRMGLTETEAKEKAEQDFNRLLPQGIKTPDHYIFHVHAEDKNIGHLWFGIRGAADSRKGFVYDIALNENVRGKGYGKKVMLLCEEEVKKLGVHCIGLHVFGHNKMARHLYESLGYEATSIQMEKKL